VSLYRAETRRLTKRRFTRWLVIGSLAVLAMVAIGVALTNQKVGPVQVEEAKVRATANYQENLRYAEQELARCQAAPGTADAANYPADCSTMYMPTEADYDYHDYMDSTFDFKANFGNMITTWAALLALAAFVIGASYVGAEWSTGGMMNLLLWRPQRLKVLGTKLAALLAGLAALSVVVALLWTGLFVLIASLRGTLDGMTSGAWQSFALTELRGLTLILVAGAVGFGLASLGRHTALALGAVVGAVVVFQFGLVTVLSLAQVKYAEAWLLPTWALAWMDKKLVLQDYNACNFSAISGCQPPELTLTWPMAGGLMAVVVVLVVGAAMWTMRNRDIT
jgi:ABC-type transport system involved in multi-copper enzyme maturation permease subunit